MSSIVCISGTSRPDNYTSRALAVVVDELSARGHEPLVLDAREMELPFPGHPATDDARMLRSAVADAAAVVLATPEYHGGFCAMTKLIIENMGFPSALAGKPVALVGVADGRIGAIKSLEQLRSVCSHTGAIVLPRAISVAGVRKAFDEDGHPSDPGTEKALRGLADALLAFLSNYVPAQQALEALARESREAWTTTV